MKYDNAYVADRCILIIIEHGGNINATIFASLWVE